MTERITPISTLGLPELEMRPGWGRKLAGGLRPVFVFLVTLLVGGGVWQILVTQGVISPIILPTPTSIVEKIWEFLRNFFTGMNYWEHTWVTLQEVVLGFLCATVTAVVLGSLVSEIRLAREMIMPYIVALNSAPKVAFVPLFVVWLGFGMAPKVLMAAFIAFFPIFVSVVSGLDSVEQDRRELFASLRANRLQLFAYLKVPSSLPMVFPSLRVAMSLSIIGAIIGEFNAGDRGLGYLVQTASAQIQVDKVFSYIVMLSILGYVLFAIMGFIERKVIFWRRTST